MKALISVYDKTGILDFAKELVTNGWEIISTGGTYKILLENGINAVKVSDFTGSPEVLGGRVKTIHPKVFAGILARDDQQDELEEHNLPRIDMVCCNLYPFEETVKKTESETEILENIDIGGVTLLRAAAKNYSNVIVVTDPGDYGKIISELKSGSIECDRRKIYAQKAFSSTAAYDKAITDYFTGRAVAVSDDKINISFSKTMDLRYGENSHQKAALYGDVPFTKIQGEKELSFNNIQDANAAVNIMKSLNDPSVIIIKHAVPCGAAYSKDVSDAYRKALSSDPMSAFGGIVGLNRRLEKNLAEEIIKTFYEVVAAPDFSDESLEVLKRKQNLRVVKYKSFKEPMDIRNVSGALLAQDPDSFEGEEWSTVTETNPNDFQMKDLEFAWKIVRFLKSNAIAIVKDGQTYGLGSGETARVGAVNVAFSKIKQFFGEDSENLVMASDAFFPFPDAVEEAAKAKVTAIVQPGGSKNDANVIAKANELSISMVFTGRRHFLH